MSASGSSVKRKRGQGYAHQGHADHAHFRREDVVRDAQARWEDGAEYEPDDGGCSGVHDIGVDDADYYFQSQGNAYVEGIHRQNCKCG